MQIKEVGIIYDINSNNFLADGSLYVNIVEENQEISLVSKTISSFSFENTVSKMIADSSAADSIKSEKYYSDEITSFFEKNKGKRMDIIFFTEYGIKGIDKVSITDSSIIYLSLYGNVKLGFLINKTIANILFGSGE